MMADAGNVSRIAPHQLESLPLGQAAPPSVQFVDSKLKYFIKEYRHRRNVSKYISNASKAASIIGPGALTIVIGLRPILGDSWFAEYSTAIPLVVSACLTGLGAWEAFSDHRWKWIRYRTTLYAIRKIKDEFDFAKSKDSVLSSKEVDEFYSRLMQVVDETNQAWLLQRGNHLVKNGKRK